MKYCLTCAEISKSMHCHWALSSPESLEAPASREVGEFSVARFVTELQRDRETERQRDRETERQRDRDESEYRKTL